METGFALKLGYNSPMDLLEKFPGFFHQMVEPLIGPALEHLKQTPDGKDVVARLYAQVSETLDGETSFGPFPGPPDASD